ncbi:uncharacterized protein LOC135594750, partial [Musa acuminata AAA Group]|uniref:uncharacterized protein LOC135594750 n=1 Tax=Musa acuminata AAA Group TaxID=214697 RepID=UPI0031DACE41
SPDVWSQLTCCWSHPPSRVIHTLSYLPSRNIFHNPGLLFQIFLPLLHNKRRGLIRERRRAASNLPADAITLVDLVHSAREGDEEDGGSVGALDGDAPGAPHGRESARRRSILEERHLPHARHPRLLLHHRLRHPYLITTTIAELLPFLLLSSDLSNGSIQ